MIKKPINSIIMKRISFISIIFLAIVFLISGCKQESKTVKIGYLPIYVDMPLFVAKEYGFFDKNNVNVELVRFESSPEIGTALTNNNIQVGASIATSVALTTESRDPNKLKIFLIDAENRTNYLSSFVVLINSGIDSIADLKGKIIGSFPGPTALTFGELVLEKFGLKKGKDYNLIEIPVGSHLSSLQSKTVDALFTYEPTGTQAVLEKNAKKISPGAVETYIIEPWQAGVWVLNHEFIEKNRDLTIRVIKSIYEAVDFMRSNPDEAKKALSKYTSIKENIALMTPNIPFTKISEADLPTLQKHSDILTEKGIISKRIDIRKMIISEEYWKYDK